MESIYWLGQRPLWDPASSHDSSHPNLVNNKGGSVPLYDRPVKMSHIYRSTIGQAQ